MSDNERSERAEAPEYKLLLFTSFEGAFEQLGAHLLDVQRGSLHACAHVAELERRCARGEVGIVFIDRRGLDDEMLLRLSALRLTTSCSLTYILIVEACEPCDEHDAMTLSAEGLLEWDSINPSILQFVLNRAKLQREREALIRAQATLLEQHNMNLIRRQDELQAEVERQNHALRHINHQLTERLALQERLTVQLQTADRLASVGLLARGIAHTLNNPLAYVQANLDMVVDELSEQQPDREYIDECMHDVLHGVRRIARIVAVVGRLNPSSQHVACPLDLRTTIQDLLETVREELWGRAQVSVELSSVSPVMAHEPGVAQIVLNLLFRASRILKHYTQGDATLDIRLWQDDERVCFSVSDSGPTLSDEEIKYLFDPFSELESSAAELYMELPVVYQLVNEFNGEIEVARGARRGMVFTVTFQVMEAEGG